jgi:AcrR family transcriptional regulator
VRIVDAGVRCIAREGVTGASMAAIAVEAGVSKALLHYHYHDRSTLLAEIVERIGIGRSSGNAPPSTRATAWADSTPLAMAGGRASPRRAGGAGRAGPRPRGTGTTRHACGASNGAERRRTIERLFTELDLDPEFQRR